MKEMRDWFYVKEIVNRNLDSTLSKNIIYCTSDSINLFRSILYNISTINLHNNNVKYMSLYENINNKKYIIYKLISPSYYYKFSNIKQNNIKQNIFAEIDKINTTIIKKEVIMNGGEDFVQTILNETSLKTKKYILKCSLMDYNKIRFELFEILTDLSTYFEMIINDNTIYKDLKKNNFNKYIDFFKNIHQCIQKYYNFLKKYCIGDLKCIDFNCSILNIDEINYFTTNDDNDDNDDNNKIDDNVIIDNDNHKKYKIHFDNEKKNYIEYIYQINDIFIKKIDEIKHKLNHSTFYFDPKYKLTSDEFNFTVLLYYSISSACEVDQRERLGYVLKMLLSDNDWKLFRNALNLFYDDFFNYSGYIKGKYKFVETFDEDKYDYITKITHNEFYPDEFDLEPIEKFVKVGIVSKYDLIIQYIKENNLDG
jgi:hypothetical protein